LIYSDRRIYLFTGLTDQFQPIPFWISFFNCNRLFAGKHPEAFNQNFRKSNWWNRVLADFIPIILYEKNQDKSGK